MASFPPVQLLPLVRRLLRHRYVASQETLYLEDSLADHPSSLGTLLH